MKTSTLNKLLIAMSLLAMISLNSCQEEEQVSGDDVTAVNSESLSDSYFQDSDEMSGKAAERNGAAGGRIAEDDRFGANAGTIIEISPNSTKAAGSLTINFGETGVKDPRGNTRKGKILVTWTGGPAINIGFKTVTTFQNYSINDIKLEGTRTVTKQAPTAGSIGLKYNAELVGGKVTWPDNTSILRASNLTAEFTLATVSTTLTGTASGTNRRGKDYTMTITEPLVYKGSCAISDGIFMAVDGTKKFTSGGRELTVDYGNGDCDRTVTVTVGAASRSVNLEGK